MRIKKILFAAALLIFGYFVLNVLTKEVEALAFWGNLLVISCKALMTYEKKQLKKE